MCARPLGSKNKQSPGLSFNKRMKVLQGIIMDSNQKTCDRLQAIKTMTDMLSDKVKETTSLNPITTIKFNEDILKKQDNNAGTIITSIIVSPKEEVTTTSTTTTNAINTANTANTYSQGSMAFVFEIGNADNTNNEDSQITSQPI